jgi:hypothetical protein
VEELKAMEEGIEITEKEKNLEGDRPIALQPRPETMPSTEFVKVEKNLASLGFFTPSSKRLRNAQEKTFTITTVADGQRLEMKGTIIPSAKYGLPITADQDKWIALCKIITDIMRKEGRVTNPISFTSAEILRLLHQHRHSGKNYREIEEWLDVLFSTTIFSEGVVYLAKEKRRVKDRYRVFERVVSFGKQLSDGKRADKNYVWFSEWQLDNINNNHLLPVDLEAYRELKNHIAKALVPLLQVWLYATRDEGVFEKRYNELCQFLNIQQYQYLSLITRTLGPSLDELKQFGYLADWRIEETSDGENFKIIFYHGEKFHRDRRARLGRKKNAGDENAGHEAANHTSSSWEKTYVESRQSNVPAVAAQPSFDPQLVAEFTRRGIREEKAIALLASLKPGQDVVAQLEYTDRTIKQLEETPHRLTNPAGFYVRMIEWNTPVPDGFETNAKRKAREEQAQKERDRRMSEETRQELEDDYERYCYQEVDQYIKTNSAAYEAIKEAKASEERKLYPTSWPQLIADKAKWDAKNEIRKQLHLPSFEEFAALKKQGTDFSFKPVGVPPVAAEESATPLPEAATGSDEPASDVAEALAATDEAELAIELTPEPPAQVVMSESQTTEPPPIELVTTTPEPMLPAPEEAGIDEPPAMPATDPPATVPDTEQMENPAIRQEAEIFPETPEPVIELASEPPQEEQGSDPIGLGLV